MTISKYDDVIDSREVIERIEELETEIEDARDSLKVSDDGVTPLDAEREALAELESELKTLKALQSEAEGYAPDWKYGATLIRESYFTEYCEELCKDIGDVPQNIPHYIEIDWEATARNIRVDYTDVEFDGITFLVR